MIPDIELLGLIREYGKVKVTYLEDQLIWLTGDGNEVRDRITELVNKGVLIVPKPGYVGVSS